MVVAAALAADEPESAACVSLCGAGAAQVDDGREVLLLLQRSAAGAGPAENPCDRAVQQRGGHLHRMARHHAGIESVEPARLQVVPRSVLDDDMVVDAVA